MGNRLRLYHLQGTLTFSTIEPVVREIVARAAETECFIINLGVVQGVDDAAIRMLAGIWSEVSRLRKHVLFAEADACWKRLTEAGVKREAFYADDDFALEFGENLLLADRFHEPAPDEPIMLVDCALFSGLTAKELALLDRLLERRRFTRGQTIISARQASDELFVITAGSAMVTIPTKDGIARLHAFTAGATFGERSFIDRSVRSANVTALNAVECRVLTRDAFAELHIEAPAIKIRLLENLSHGLASMLRQADRELAALR